MGTMVSAMWAGKGKRNGSSKQGLSPQSHSADREFPMVVKRSHLAWTMVWVSCQAEVSQDRPPPLPFLEVKRGETSGCFKFRAGIWIPQLRET